MCGSREPRTKQSGKTTVRQLQVIAAAMAAGCLMFLIVAAALLGGVPATWLGQAKVAPIIIAVTIGQSGRCAAEGAGSGRARAARSFWRGLTA